MPGYILHLTAAVMFLSGLPETHSLCLPEKSNAFFAGSLLPDAVKVKTASHFRNPAFFGNMVEYPELNLFLDKYGGLLEDASALGYFFHLYIDRRFFKEYLPQVVSFLDEKGQIVQKKEKVVWAYLRKTKRRIPIREFYSEEYYYGDYTRMNTYLAERYKLPLELNVNLKNPGIEEVNYQKLDDILRELRGYLKVPVNAVREVRVFDVEELLAFLEEAAEEFRNNKYYFLDFDDDMLY